MTLPAIRIAAGRQTSGLSDDARVADKVYGAVVVGATLLVHGQGDTQKIHGMNQPTSMQTEEQATRAVIERFNQAFNRHDADELAELLTMAPYLKTRRPRPMDGGWRARPR
jgi:hypothetical protein